MSDLYVPIDSTDIRKVIPPGLDIFYSSLCKCSAQESDGRNFKTYTWNSHILITDVGIALSIPNNVGNNKYVTYFLKWYRINLRKGGFSLLPVRGEIKFKCIFQLARDGKFESIETFEIRRQQFWQKFAMLREERTVEMVDKVYEIIYEDYKMKKKDVEKNLGEKGLGAVFSEAKKRRKGVLKQQKLAEKQKLKEEKKEKKK